MGSVAEPNIEALLLAARVEFAARLPTRVGEIREFAAREAWVDARRAAHKLRGSASTYGFAEIGALAALLEEMLLSAGPSPDAATRLRFEEMLAQAHEQADRASKPQR